MGIDVLTLTKDGRERYFSIHQQLDTRFIMPKFGGAPKCGRCGKSVYQQEEKIAAGGSWHKGGCFTCKDCNKSLDSNTIAEKKAEGEGVGEIYCKGCYGKNWGPKGFGFGQGAGTLANTGKS